MIVELTKEVSKGFKQRGSWECSQIVQCKECHHSVERLARAIPRNIRTQ